MDQYKEDSLFALPGECTKAPNSLTHENIFAKFTHLNKLICPFCHLPYSDAVERSIKRKDVFKQPQKSTPPTQQSSIIHNLNPRSGSDSFVRQFLINSTHDTPPTKRKDMIISAREQNFIGTNRQEFREQLAQYETNSLLPDDDPVSTQTNEAFLAAKRKNSQKRTSNLATFDRIGGTKYLRFRTTACRFYTVGEGDEKVYMPTTMIFERMN